MTYSTFPSLQTLVYLQRVSLASHANCGTFPTDLAIFLIRCFPHMRWPTNLQLSVLQTPAGHQLVSLPTCMMNHAAVMKHVSLDEVALQIRGCRPTQGFSFCKHLLPPYFYFNLPPWIFAIGCLFFPIWCVPKWLRFSEKGNSSRVFNSPPAPLNTCHSGSSCWHILHDQVP